MYKVERNLINIKSIQNNYSTEIIIANVWNYNRVDHGNRGAPHFAETRLLSQFTLRIHTSEFKTIIGEALIPCSW